MGNHNRACHPDPAKRERDLLFFWPLLTAPSPFGFASLDYARDKQGRRSRLGFGPLARIDRLLIPQCGTALILVPALPVFLLTPDS